MELITALSGSIHLPYFTLQSGIRYVSITPHHHHPSVTSDSRQILRFCFPDFLETSPPPSRIVPSLPPLNPGLSTLGTAVVSASAHVWGAQSWPSPFPRQGTPRPNSPPKVFPWLPGSSRCCPAPAFSPSHTDRMQVGPRVPGAVPGCGPYQARGRMQGHRGLWAQTR